MAKNRDATRLFGHFNYFVFGLILRIFQLSQIMEKNISIMHCTRDISGQVLVRHGLRGFGTYLLVFNIRFNSSGMYFRVFSYFYSYCHIPAKLAQSWYQPWEVSPQLPGVFKFPRGRCSKFNVMLCSLYTITSGRSSF